MSIHVTVGEITSRPDAASSRGTVSVTLATPSEGAAEESMIEVTSSLNESACVVRLTIAESEILQNALDSLILEAAVPGLGTESSARGRY